MAVLMRIGRRLGGIAQTLRRELAFCRMVMAHPETPRAARWLLIAAVAYAAWPIDLIPDAIPVIGHLDDLIIVPALAWLAIRLVPGAVIAECRRRADTLTAN
jgi:uncharacterized membrane protein YkvA (DUF1232 family)